MLALIGRDGVLAEAGFHAIHCRGMGTLAPFVRVEPGFGVLLWLEHAGFVPRGESGPFVEGWAVYAERVMQDVELKIYPQAVAWMAPRRAFPRFAKKPFRRVFRKRPKALGQRVILWPDTFNDHFHPRTARAAVRARVTRSHSSAATVVRSSP